MHSFGVCSYMTLNYVKKIKNAALKNGKKTLCVNAPLHANSHAFTTDDQQIGHILQIVFFKNQSMSK